MTPLPLNTLEACDAFIKSHSPSEIAERIIQDQQLCRDNGLPSLLVYRLPETKDAIAHAISGDTKIPLPVARMRLGSIISSIKSHLANISRSRSSEDIPAHLIPTDADFNASLKVLRYLQQLPSTGIRPDPSTAIQTVIDSVQAQLSLGRDMREAMNQQHRKQKPCYICRFTIAAPHRLYPSLCNPCGEFNIASSSLSLPENLDLHNKTALVTGGRINLGYHTALRLLRCGAKVVVSTRYPLDAQSRFLAEPDSSHWHERLRVVGADFRSAKDVFALIKAVVSCLKTWNQDHVKLDILINNAAQTLTDSVEKEDGSIQREAQLNEENTQTTLLTESTYKPRIRGGVTAYQMIESTTISSHTPEENAQNGESTLITAKNMKSSWVQSLEEIPYEDVISAHSVNAFVPFILLRELLPFMSASSKSSDKAPSWPQPLSPPAGYVVNVSSREGLYEKKPGHSAKAGQHVHTNMSKAALNMLTETEASSAWRDGRVAINTVDPGYMSADPEYQKMVGMAGEPCPIGWEDGAGRVLWPIARGERGDIIRGRFLKHFTAIDAVR